ncbi:MAG: uridine diphosphate-N-acetylglucosamine-binding protein YvcK [Fimbriimonadaceae bacterium]|nr:uridine diphosphate-N-acetylglucosamine-binding protein YvcK [Fimbriimonadaceae bacterium]
MAKRPTFRFRWRRLIAPAMGLRRPVITMTIGIIITIFGVGITFQSLIVPMLSGVARGWAGLVSRAFPEQQVEITTHLIGGLILFVGVGMALYGGRLTGKRLIQALDPNAGQGFVDVWVRRQQLSKGPNIVAIGGGTGLSTLLRGLKEHTSNITAVVTVTDDGGSSGRLVREMGILPPGDLRNCLVALADAERRMTDLFQHRFRDAAGSLSGHSIGNLLLAALIDQSNGDVDKALMVASQVLNIRGRVVPSTTRSVVLRAVMEDGTEITGETAIVASSHRVRRIFIEPQRVEAHPAAIAAIQNADLIVIGPGSVYTSIIPNLLVPGLAEELANSTCIRAYVCNVMTQRGESDHFTAAEHIVALNANVDTKVIDHVLVNVGVPSPEALERYKESLQELVVPDSDRIRAMGLVPVEGDYMSETDVVRHDPVRLADRIIGLLYK